MKRLLPLLLATALIASCHRDTFSLEGTLDNGANKTIYIEEITPGEGPLFIDSIKLDAKGRFSFRYKLPYESFYNIHTSMNNYIVILPQTGEKIKLYGDYNNLEGTYEVEGSPESSLLWQLQDYSNIGVEALQEIVALNAFHQGICTDSAKFAQAKQQGKLDEKWRYVDTVKFNKLRKKTDSIYLETYGIQQDFIVEFITKNRGSLSTLIALYKPFNNHPLIDPEQNFDYYEFVLEGLEEEKPQNPHTIHFANTVAYLRHKYPAKEALDWDISVNQ